MPPEEPHIGSSTAQATRFLDHRAMPVDDVVDYVRLWLESHPKGSIYVGADSKVRGEWVKYSTVVCLWDVGRGVWELHRSDLLPKPKDSYSRLWEEVNRAVETAHLLRNLGEVTVHVDINADPRFKSHPLYDASMGFITSLGYKAAGKPYSWAASCGAHRHCQ